MISDYVFPDETDLDISERIKELFSVELVDSSKQIIFVEDLTRNYILFILNLVTYLSLLPK